MELVESSFVESVSTLQKHNSISIT